MKKSKLFKSKNISYRDSDIDEWFPEEVQDGEDGEITSFDTEKPMTFKEMFKGKESYLFSLPQIERMIESPEKYNLKTDGYSNFFLAQGKDEVCVLRARRDGSLWRVGVRRRGRGHAWDAEYRVFLRNQTLESSESLTLLRAIEICKENNLTVTKTY